MLITQHLWDSDPRCSLAKLLTAMVCVGRSLPLEHHLLKLYGLSSVRVLKQLLSNSRTICAIRSLLVSIHFCLLARGLERTDTDVDALAVNLTRLLLRQEPRPTDGEGLVRFNRGGGDVCQDLKVLAIHPPKGHEERK